MGHWISMLVMLGGSLLLILHGSRSWILYLTINLAGMTIEFKPNGYMKKLPTICIVFAHQWGLGPSMDNLLGKNLWVWILFRL